VLGDQRASFNTAVICGCSSSDSLLERKVDVGQSSCVENKDHVESSTSPVQDTVTPPTWALEAGEGSGRGDYAMYSTGVQSYGVPSCQTGLVPRKYYAVVRGVRPGIYYNWPNCKLQIDRFRGARYKSFLTQSEAEEFLRTGVVSNRVSSTIGISYCNRIFLYCLTYSVVCMFNLSLQLSNLILPKAFVSKSAS
jgi:hypothetical protein